jgi:hypothetical protein
MKAHQLLVVGAAAIFALTGSAALAQERQDHTQFDEKDQKAARDYYSQHKDHPPAGLRDQDRLSPDQESRLHEGAVLDKDLRKRVHPAPPELARQLPPPPPDHRYVAVGGHIGLIDNKYQVKAVIHLH